ncbi:MAG: hypothetical protein K0S56_2027 [Microvirga sp.]|jgi:hypothetical protein|nr:hypothetical protein [Microvirga sp.]
MKIARYVGGFLLFFVTYAIVATIARVSGRHDAENWGQRPRRPRPA